MILDLSSSNWIFLINKALSPVKNIMSNFNFCIFEPPQPIPNHFMGIPASFSHSYYFLNSFWKLFFIMFFYFYFFYFLFFIFFCGNPKMDNNRCPLFTILTKQNIINVLHSKLVKKKKKKKQMISLSWATCPFWRKLVYFHGLLAHTHSH